MEAAEGAEVRERGAGERGSGALTAPVGNGGRGPALSGQSYWLDVWFMLLIDLLLFVFVYLLP